MFGFECLATPIRRSARVTEMDRTAIAQIAPHGRKRVARSASLRVT
jgi:hypothetical protein